MPPPPSQPIDVRVTTGIDGPVGGPTGSQAYAIQLTFEISLAAGPLVKVTWRLYGAHDTTIAAAVVGQDPGARGRDFAAARVDSAWPSSDSTLSALETLALASRLMLSGTEVLALKLALDTPCRR
jgi:hypothetical protein